MDGADRWKVFVRLQPALVKGLPFSSKTIRPEHHFTFLSVAAFAVDYLRDKLKPVVHKQVGREMVLLHASSLLLGRAVPLGLHACHHALCWPHCLHQLSQTVLKTCCLLSSMVFLQQPRPPITMLPQDANFSGGLEHALFCVVREMQEKGVSADDLQAEAREEVGGSRASRSHR